MPGVEALSVTLTVAGQRQIVLDDPWRLRMYKGASRYIQHRRRQASASALVKPRGKFRKNNKGKRNNSRFPARQRRLDLERIRIAQQQGEVLVGSVKSIQPYGAFVALGSIDGLVHISEVADHRIHNLSALLRPGMSVQVVVLRVDGDGKRIALSMRKVP
jgi:transcriptional accessory protein Tex/SPT6